MKLLLVDDHTLVRKGLIQVMQNCVPDAEVTEAGSAEEALEILHQTPHDVALVDIRMPGRDGIELLKDASPEDLAQAILVALSGSGNVLSPRAVRNLFEGSASEHVDARETHLPDVGLTRREVDVMQLLSGGASNREISRQLFLSEKTVKAHLAAVFRKLGVTNRTQAAMAAVAMGMGTPQPPITRRSLIESAARGA